MSDFCFNPTNFMQNLPITKPQDQFDWKIDNSHQEAFSEHPFEKDLRELKNQSKSFQQLLEKSQGPQAFEAIKQMTYVDTQVGLQRMVQRLSFVELFCFDFHNHSIRSFMGFTCFLEISTLQGEHYLIDCIKLRLHLGKHLSQPFQNPRIFKVCFESQQQLLWLQRDFAIFCVNLLDLSQVCQSLSLPSALPFLTLSEFSFNFKRINANFDYRKRPISEKEKQFLQSFSFWAAQVLVKLKDRLNQQILDITFENSKQLCLKLFKKAEFVWDSSYLDISRGFQINNNQLKLLNRLLKWRELVCRLTDESRSFILPNEMIIQVLHLSEKAVELKEIQQIFDQYRFEVEKRYIESIFQILRQCQKKNETRDQKFESQKQQSRLTQGGILQQLSQNQFKSPNIEQSRYYVDEPSFGAINQEHKKVLLRKMFDELKSQEKSDEKPDLSLYVQILSKEFFEEDIFLEKNGKVDETLIQLLRILNARSDSNQFNREIVGLIEFLKQNPDHFVKMQEQSQKQTLKSKIPNSRDEIYQLANISKLINKNSKKRNNKQESKDQDPSDSDEIGTPQDQNKNIYKKQFNHNAILKKIGWGGC